MPDAARRRLCPRRLHRSHPGAALERDRRTGGRAPRPAAQIQRRPIRRHPDLARRAGAALFLAHETRALGERINAYLGRAAVAQVKFVQGALTPLPAPPRPPKPAPAARTDDPVHKYQGPEGLKKALQSLARWRAPRQER